MTDPEPELSEEGAKKLAEMVSQPPRAIPKLRELLGRGSFKAKAWAAFHVAGPVVRLFCGHDWQSMPLASGGRRWICARCVWIYDGGGPTPPNAWDYLLSSRTIRYLALIAAGVIAGLAVWGRIEMLLLSLGKSP